MIRGTKKRLRLPLDSEEYRALKRGVLERDGWKCQACGRRDQLEVHHQIGHSQLGPDAADNLIVLCSLCHRARHGRSGETGEPE